MKRVVMIAPAHRPSGNRVVREAASLASAGYDVTAIVETEREHHARGVCFLPARMGPRSLRQVVWLARLLRQALRLDADIYHLHNPAMIPVAVGLKLAGRTVIYDTHEDFSRRLMMRQWIPQRLRRLACWVVSRAEYALSRFVDATLVTQARQVARFPGRVQLLRNAPSMATIQDPHVNELRAAIREERDGFRLVYVGSLTRARGHAKMLSVLEKLEERGVKARLWLIGPDYDGVLDDLRAHPGWSRVDYMGRKSHEEALAFMAEADVGLAVLPDVGDHSDALPSKLFEYMAMELPFVASNFPVWRSFVGEEAGQWVDPENEEHVFNAVYALLVDSEKRLSCSQAGGRFVDEFNWEYEEKTLVALHEALMNC